MFFLQKDNIINTNKSKEKMSELELYIYDSFIKNGYDQIIRIEIEKSKQIGSEDNYIRYIFRTHSGERFWAYIESNIMKNATSNEGRIIRSALITYKRNKKLNKI
jgi:hypothetical protein